MAELLDLAPSKNARYMLSQGRLAAQNGNISLAEECWRRAQSEACAPSRIDCGALFLSAAHLALVYKSREYFDESKIAVQNALKAFRRAFGCINYDEGGNLPPQLVKILESLHEVCPQCFDGSIRAVSSTDPCRNNVKRFSKEELMDIRQKVLPSTEHEVKEMMSRIGYESVDIIVDVHPDNLQSQKKNFRKNSSKKKKTKPDAAKAGRAPVDNNDVHRGYDRNRTDIALQSIDDALAWADALDNKTKSALGTSCELYIDAEGTKEHENSVLDETGDNNICSGDIL